MKRFALALALLLSLPGMAGAQFFWLQFLTPVTAEANLPTCADGSVYENHSIFTKTPAPGSWYHCPDGGGTWACVAGEDCPGGGGGGSAIVLDLGDDASNESAGVLEIATTGDTSSIFTEPAADKLLIAVGNAWPLATLSTTATTANAGDSATGFFTLGLLEHERGGLEANVSAFAGLVRIAAGSTSAVTTLGGLNTALGSSIADGAHTVDTDTTCLDAGVACLFAGSASEGGPATSALDLTCTNCIDDTEVTTNAGTALSADLEEETHAAEHQNGGADEVATATAGANAIPKAGAGGTLADGWIASSNVTQHEAAIEGVLDLADLQGDLALGTKTSGGYAASTTEGGGATSLEANAVDAITEIAVGLKSGLDGTLVTGTAGATDDCAKWDANGDLVSAGAACGSGGGGSLTVEEADGTPTVGSVDTIQFDSADGFTVTDETGGNVQVDLLFAKLLDLDGDGAAAVGGTSGTDITFNPSDDGSAEASLNATGQMSVQLTPAAGCASGCTANLGVKFGDGDSGWGEGGDDVLTAYIGTSSARVLDIGGSGILFYQDLIAVAGSVHIEAGATSLSAVGFAPARNDLNTGLRSAGLDDWRMTSGGVDGLGGTATEVDVYLIRDDAEQSVGCTNTGSDATPGTVTITPTTSYVELSNPDVDGCTATLSETGATVGRVVDITVVSNAGGTVTFTDTAGVTEMAGNFAMGIDDYISFRYGNTTTWRERFRTNS